MNQIYNFKNNQPIVWFHRNIEYSNHWCLFCGEFVGPESKVSSNKEHLIGRDFVPKGSMNGTNFNFIFRACEKCNGVKSNVERHVSSVTLFNSPERSEDERINDIALNKAEKDFHPDNPGKTVVESFGQYEVKYGDFMKFKFTSPPQLNREYVKLLSCYHVQGIFSLLTTMDPKVQKKSGLLPPNQIFYFNAYNVQDWGNPQLLEIAERTKDWPCYCNINTANGFWKIVFKRSSENEGWFWALEWNQYLRAIGGIALPDYNQKIFQKLPELNWKHIQNQDGTSSRTRKEIPLEDEKDELFIAEVISTNT